VTTTSRRPLPKLNALSQLKSTKNVEGLTVGGLWRLRDGQIEVQRFGGVWSRPQLSQLQKGPKNVLVWHGQMVLAPG
jgi:hypothetical protein